MNIKSKSICALLLTGLLLGGSIVMQHPCFSEDEQSPDSQVAYKKPTSDFKQLTNQELYEAFLLRIKPEYHDHENFSRDKYLKQQQNYIDSYFDTLCLGHYRDDSEILDKSLLQKMAWVVETDKIRYIGEPVNIRISLQNISDDEVLVYSLVGLGCKLALLSTSLKKCEKTEKTLVYLTERGYKEAYFHPDDNRRTPRNSNSIDPDILKTFPAMQTILLKPGEKVRRYLGVLNPFYDLSEPGEYELTFYTRNFLGSDDEQIGEYPKPCTIRFKIEGNTNRLAEHVKWPNEDKDREDNNDRP